MRRVYALLTSVCFVLNGCLASDVGTVWRQLSEVEFNSAVAAAVSVDSVQVTSISEDGDWVTLYGIVFDLPAGQNASNLPNMPKDPGVGLIGAGHINFLAEGINCEERGRGLVWLDVESDLGFRSSVARVVIVRGLLRRQHRVVPDERLVSAVRTVFELELRSVEMIGYRDVPCRR